MVICEIAVILGLSTGYSVGWVVIFGLLQITSKYMCHLLWVSCQLYIAFSLVHTSESSFLQLHHRCKDLLGFSSSIIVDVPRVLAVWHFMIVRDMDLSYL